MNIKLVYCHNHRTKPVNQRVKPEAICNKVLGGVDEKILLLAKEKNLEFQLIFYCGPCSSFNLITISGGEISVEVVEKEKLNFGNKLNSKVNGYKIKSTAIYGG